MITRLILCFLASTSGIYPYQAITCNNTTIQFDAYAGKKLLLVNIATQSQYAGQLTDLQALQDRYDDRLAVVAFASNSFGNEPNSNESLHAYLTDLNIRYPVVALNDVTGEQAHPVYQWLANSAENGVINGKVVGDFQKFLINESGRIIGVFRDEISPLDTLITHAIAPQQP